MMRTARKLVTVLSGGASAPPVLSFSATTTGATQTLTLQTVGVATGETCVVDWGDGSATQDWTGEATRSHVYASAGTYAISVSNPSAIVKVDLRDAKLGCAAGEIGGLTSLTSLALRSVATVTVGAGEIGGLTSLETLHLSSVASVTVGAGEIGGLTSLTALTLNSTANVTVGAGEIGGLTSLTSLYLNSTANVTVGAGEIGGLTSLETLYLYNVASVTVGAGEIGGLTLLTALTLYNAPNVTVGAGEIGGLTLLTALTLYNVANVALPDGFGSLIAIRTIQYENSLSTADVDSVIAQIYAARASYTYATPSLDLLGGSNQAPSATPTVDTYIPALTAAPYNWTIEVAS